MNYIHTTTGDYPVTLEQIQKTHPLTIFPEGFSDAFEDYAPVQPVDHPAHDAATHKAAELPPVEEGGQWLQAWQVVPLTPQEIEARDADAAERLAAALQAARAAVEAWRDAQEQARMQFEHAGRAWDGGLAVRARMQPVLSLPGLPDGFFWTDAQNNDVPMSLPALQALNAAHEQALVMHGFQIHARQRAMKQALDSMTLEELAAFEPGWEGGDD